MLGPYIAPPVQSAWLVTLLPDRHSPICDPTELLGPGSIL